MQLINPDINLNFMGWRKLFLAISAAMMLLSFIFLIARGINYGIDFAGGMLIQVKFEKRVTADEIRNSMNAIGLHDAMVQSYGKDEDNEFLVRSQAAGISLDKAGDLVLQALRKGTGDEKAKTRRVETVGPKAGKDLREKALLALIGIYIASGPLGVDWGTWLTKDPDPDEKPAHEEE